MENPCMKSSRGIESKERKLIHGNTMKYSDKGHHKDSTYRIESKEQYGPSPRKRKHPSSDDDTITRTTSSTVASETKTKKKRIKKEEIFNHHSNDYGTTSTTTLSATDSRSKKREIAISSTQPRDLGHLESFVSKGQRCRFARSDGGETSLGDQSNTTKPSQTEMEKKRNRKEELSSNRSKLFDDSEDNDDMKLRKKKFRELFFCRSKNSRPKDMQKPRPRNWKICNGNIVCSLSEKTTCCCERIMADLKDFQRSWFSSEVPPFERHWPNPINNMELLNRMRCQERRILLKEQRKNDMLRKEILGLRARLR
uniref:Uncharacterized protein n=1 Tax=Melicertus latisulcatus pemonivirus TaxID=2984278 RepID=A0A9C7EYL8_9VIRU|nr:MAG: hypothetical protein [Melicertus latisulcatus pemonivirus]